MGWSCFYLSFLEKLLLLFFAHFYLNVNKYIKHTKKLLEGLIDDHNSW